MGEAQNLPKHAKGRAGKALDSNEHKGDIGFQFEVLPCVGMRLIFWDADDDFSAQVQILLDQKVLDFVHYETTGCMISDLFEKICSAV